MLAPAPHRCLSTASRGGAVSAGEHVQRVDVWSGWLRLSHWSSALAVVILLGSGWLLVHLPASSGAVRELHLGAGYVLLAALLLRLHLLLFGRGAEQWRDLLPRGPQWQAAGQTLRFYLSLGRAPLPAWFAHNPLWSPVYLLWWLVLAATLVSGLVPGVLAAAGLQPWWWHSMLAEVTEVLVLAHLVAVFAHDLKGGGADVSAMINGRRCFRTGRGPASLQDPHSVSLDSLLRGKRRSDL